MEILLMGLGAFVGSVVGTVVGLALGGRQAAKALRDELRERKWLRELSMVDRNITRDGATNPGTTRVRKARIRRK